jgi:4-diphosphocytidyl-2-C-methyl-D-erythritol kinase
MADLPVTSLVEQAPAKVNLTLRVHGRRGDGYHGIESIVAFARIGDRVALVRDRPLGVEMRGPQAKSVGAGGDNLVLKAAHALQREFKKVQLGHFTVIKHLPVAAGLGGGSADAAAALRLIARINDMRPGDPRIFAAARFTGADVPVCLESKMRLMRGIGDILSEPILLAPLPALLVNPGVELATKDVFAALDRPPAAREPAEGKKKRREFPSDLNKFLSFLDTEPNDLQTVALSLRPIIAEVIEALRALPGCRLARMSGSGPTCFALFEGAGSVTTAARGLKARHPEWWISATLLGSAAAEAG